MPPENFEMIACPLCEADDPRPWGEEAGYNAAKCGGCGLVYVTPRPSALAITEATKMGQHQTGSGVLDVKFRRKRSRVVQLQRVVQDMYADAIVAGRPLDWLDIGAGYGEFVEALTQSLPPESKVVGIEPMEHKVKAADSLGLRIENTELSQIDDAFGVISLMNVFSHIPDFGHFLKEIREKLRTGGEVFIQTGNGGDLDKRSDYPSPLYLPDHLIFAGERHIETFLKSAGFKLLDKRKFRVDTPISTAKNVVKRLLGRPSRIVIPYTSRFRTVYYRAQAI